MRLGITIDTNFRKKEAKRMGLTIEFYSAFPQELVALYASEDDDFFDEKVQTYSVADFSLHLVIPDDLDQLCQALRECGVLVPLLFRNLLVEQVWVDDPQMPSASLTVVQDTLARTFSTLTNGDIEEMNRKWVATFPGLHSEVLKREIEMNTAKALFSLREIAQDVVARNTSLLLFLSGDSDW